MTKRAGAIPPKLQAWIQARKRHHLSHAQVQMARELVGTNPTMGADEILDSALVNLGQLVEGGQHSADAPLQPDLGGSHRQPNRCA